MKKLLTLVCLALMFTATPALAAPKKCKTVQKCKQHKMLQGHKVPVKKK
jgi:hypothetical protein